MGKKAKQEMSFSKAKQRGMVWDRAMHKYKLESMGVAPGSPHPHRTLGDTPICVLFIYFFFVSQFAPICANSGRVALV